MSQTALPSTPHSRKRVTRAGELLRQHRLRECPLDPDEYSEQLAVVEAFRARHATPLKRVAANLRHYVLEAAGDRPRDVGQRLKAMPTILDKLTRHPEMELARMHDIGGCRGILPDQHAVDHVIRRIHAQRRWNLRDRVYDYVSEPKLDGYRAKHLVAIKDDVLIEIQLRTRAQHRWAELVERLDRAHRLDIKAGRATAPTRDLFALISQLMDLQERGVIADEEFMRRLADLAPDADTR